VLNPATPNARNLRRERRLWDDESRNATVLGCAACRDREICGGLHVRPGLFDCLQYCCGDPNGCDRVCPTNPTFPDRVREVGRFSLSNVPQSPALSVDPLPRILSVVFHGNRRQAPANAEVFALPLHKLIDRRSGSPRFAGPTELRAAFRLHPEARIVLSGVDRDAALERWWGLGEAGRRRNIQSLLACGVSMTSTPNFSLFIDRPRWDDLHAMKRIAIVFAEFMSEGMPTALHVNGRTVADFERWAEFIADHVEVTHLAYEFGTGAGWAGRRIQHATWLARVAAAVGRPLHLVLRGGMDVLPILDAAFASVTTLDTSAFMKAMMRQRAMFDDSGNLTWMPVMTAAGAPLDQLFAENLELVARWRREMDAAQAFGGLLAA
jgi:hypothetical protein